MKHFCTLARTRATAGFPNVSVKSRVSLQGTVCLNLTSVTVTGVKLKVGCSLHTYMVYVSHFRKRCRTAPFPYLSKYSALRWVSLNVEINQMRNGRSTIYISSYFTRFFVVKVRNKHNPQK